MTGQLAGLLGFAFLAGFIDSVAGGGGLIQVPALFILMPGTEAATLLGTNKCASIWGTAAATVQYSRQVPMIWRSVLPTCVGALIFGFLGARTVAHVPSDFMRPAVLVLLVAVLIYTLWKKDFGHLHAPRLSHGEQFWVGLATGAALGFYDGFFGPGTGSFLIFAFIGLFGFSFLAASASAKVVNVITNLAALIYFVASDHVLYKVAAPMAVCNVAGSLVGSHVAIRKGSAFVRLIFIIVVGALILRFGVDLLWA